MTPLETSLAYFRAWTTGDTDTAWALLAEDVVCHTPAGPLQGREAVAAFMGPFAAMLTHSNLLASGGDAEESTLVYDTATSAVASAPAAEVHAIREGLITEIRIIFDRLPFALARGEVAPLVR
ncbi:nuclear transport factor 2 family protein [Knoellia sp. CPCC 206453]|uniref:nuclear transport factor 2 family protein n=1 Tax=Knoellia pratensis TaxID=3404796 RepID=UPI003620EA95